MVWPSDSQLKSPEAMTTDPIFYPAFGTQWDKLPPVFKAHYANRAYTNDYVRLDGEMYLHRSLLAKLLSPFLSLAGALVPYDGEEISTTVLTKSFLHDAGYYFERHFRFADGKEFSFKSCMMALPNGDMVDWLRSGIGWQTQYSYQDGKVLMTHRGYRFRLGRLNIRLPLEWLIGKTTAWEEAISDTQLRMRMEIRHPLWGLFYAYGGEFTLSEVVLK